MGERGREGLEGRMEGIGREEMWGVRTEAEEVMVWKGDGERGGWGVSEKG